MVNLLKNQLKKSTEGTGDLIANKNEDAVANTYSDDEITAQSVLKISLETSKERETGSCKCKGNRCQVCLNISETETFTSTVTHTSYKINRSFDCNDKCLICLLTCKICLKQYVGSTTDCSDIVGTIINVLTENMQEVRLVCKNIFLNILIAKSIMGSYMTFQLH